MESGAPPADWVAQAVVEVCPEAAPVTIRRSLRAGRSHRSWLVDSALGPVVAKVGLAEPNPVAVARLAEHKRAWEHGAPVPRVLAIASNTAALGGRLLVVLEYLPGVDAETALPWLAPGRFPAVLRAAGRAVAALHTAGAGSFGHPSTGLGAGPRCWAEYVAGRAEILREAAAEAGHETDERVEAAFDLVAALANAVSPVVTPGLVHGDVYLPNLLVGADDAVWLLDLEHLRWVDPVMDFVKPAMWMFEGRPDWADAFVEGYRSMVLWPERWEERLAVSTGLELLTGLGYWVRVGDQAMGADYAARLRRWVDAGGRAHEWPGRIPR